MLTLKEWLEKYGQDSCAGCQYINLEKAHCSYKGGYCARYDQYRSDEKRSQPQQLSILWYPPPTEFSVTVCLPGYGRFAGGTYDIYRTFRDERKARDYYTDMLVRYPNREVKFEKKP